jgi:preprotein translocase subunit SecE
VGNTVAKTQTTAGNPISNSIAFFKDAWEELKKVHFPTRAETIQSTIGVLFLLVLFAVFLGLTDVVVGRIMREIMT